MPGLTRIVALRATLTLVVFVAAASMGVVGAISGKATGPAVSLEADPWEEITSEDTDPPAQVSEPVSGPAATGPARIRTCFVPLPKGLPSESEFFGHVTLAETGDVLWQVGGDEPTVPASVLKLVTAKAALTVLGPDYRFVTRVVEGVAPGEMWLVGGGDPTLSRTSTGTTTYYTSPPRLSELANQLTTSVPGIDVATVGVDTSRYEGFPQWNDTWRPNAATLGFVTPVTSLMVDGGRLNPSGRLSARTTDPVGQAVSAFTAALGDATGSWGVDITFGQAPAETRVLAEVWSQPVAVLIDQMLRDSDNQIAEALLREVAVVSGVSTLDDAARFGMPENVDGVDGFSAEDGSGLSHNNRLSAGLAASVLADLVAADDADVVVSSLAVPGEPGSLLRRANSFGAAAASVSAKTGSLPGVRSLAGIIDGDDDLIFSVFVTGPGVDDSVRDDIDALIEQFYSCGENLAHFLSTDQGD